MNEIKQPKKQLITYIIMVAVVMVLLNSLIMPSLKQAQITETDYNTFITMTESDQIKEVEITSSQILFTDNDGKVYATAPVTDLDLANRLHAHNVKFGSDIVQPMSPILSFLISWVVPIFIFWGLWSFLGTVVIPQQEDDEPGRRPQFHDVRNGKEQRQNLCPVYRGDPFLRCGG